LSGYAAFTDADKATVEIAHFKGVVMNETSNTNDLFAEGSVRPGPATKEFGVGRTQLYEWMSRGLLPFAKVGRMRLIPRAALKKLLAEHLVAAPAK
jgi:excisionase family DNA binding protein